MQLLSKDPTKDREAEFILEYIENFFEVGGLKCPSISILVLSMSVRLLPEKFAMILNAKRYHRRGE